MVAPGGPAPYLFGEVASLAVIAGAFTQVLPTVATFLAIVWYVVMILEARIARRERRARKNIEQATAMAAKALDDKAVVVAEALMQKAAVVAEAVVQKAVDVAAEKPANDKP